MDNENKNSDNYDEFDLASQILDDDAIDNEKNKENIDEERKTNDSAVISKSKLVLVKKLLSNIKENSDKLNQILSSYITEEDEAKISVSQGLDEKFEPSEGEEGGSKIIEGVFDGENMIGPDGKQYSVPANYASKSKLVEGDILKLTITAKGTFVYKQISPIDRSRVISILEKGSDGNFYAIDDNKKWRLLTASVTYFKGDTGDEVVILVPKNGESKWAAVENIVKKPNDFL